MHIEKIKDLFQEIDEAHTGIITYETFQQKMRTPEVRSWLVVSRHLFFGLDFHHSFGKILPRGVCKIFPNAPVAQPVTQEHTLRPSTLMFGMPGVSSNSLTSTKADGRVTAVLQEKARVDTRDSSCCKKFGVP